MAAKKPPADARKGAAQRKRGNRTATQQTPTPKKRPKPDALSKMEARIAVFVREYLVDLNGRRAAIRAGYSPASARFTASELLTREDVQAKIQAAMDERAERTGITAERVLDRLWGIATADPRELIELHRGCCRYCHGTDHRYQRTAQEMRTARAAYEKAIAAAQKEGVDHVAPFDEAGGIGWNPKRDPDPECPECFGDGVPQVVPKDTRDLSPSARLLYAGVKQTQQGLQVLTHDQKGALVDIGKHLGLFREKVEVTGSNGGPLEHREVGVIVVPAKGSMAVEDDGSSGGS